uniref:Uncharacterized protein n=1 Tax=Oryza rufipogon TaxID=4529 RepID=A0A0E0PZI4_ORYRU
MELGASIAGLSASMMVAWYFLSPEARGAHNLRYVGLALLAVVMAPLALVLWYIGSLSEGGDERTAHEEHKEQLEAAFKLISAISNSASGGLVSLAVNYNATGGSGKTKTAVLVAAFFIFTSTISGLLSMEIRAKVLEIKNKKLRVLIIKSMWLAIVVMLLSLAGAILAEVFAIVEFYIFVAFAPWVFAALLYLFLEHCIRQRAHATPDSNANEVRIKWKAERGIKFAMWSFTAIIGWGILKPEACGNPVEFGISSWSYTVHAVLSVIEGEVAAAATAKLPLPSQAGASSPPAGSDGGEGRRRPPSRSIRQRGGAPLPLGCRRAAVASLPTGSSRGKGTGAPVRCLPSRRKGGRHRLPRSSPPGPHSEGEEVDCCSTLPPVAARWGRGALPPSLLVVGGRGGEGGGHPSPLG